MPIGLGSGICGLIGARDLLGCSTGSSAWSPSARKPIALRSPRAASVTTDSALTFADGMAVRVPDATALEIIRRGAERIVEVSDDEIAEAIRVYLRRYSQLRRGRRRAALAALMKERDRRGAGASP